MREPAEGQTDPRQEGGRYPDAENFLYPLLHPGQGAGRNVSFYSTRSHAVVDQAHPIRTREAQALYVQADQIEFADAPMIYLFFYKDLYGVQPWIKGFQVPAVFNGQRWTDVTISQ